MSSTDPRSAAPLDGVVAQFPLGTVLFPGMPLPLHIFEPRYRELLADVLAGDGRFGVVLIERGSEVGGGDQRALVGTLARIVEHEIYPDGRAAVMAVGVERFRVRQWLVDDPYPRADVEALPEAVPAADRLPGLRQRAEEALTRSIELAIAVSRRPVPPPSIDLPPDPIAASHLMAALSPLSSFDKQRLLAAAGPAERLEQLVEALSEAIERFEFQLDR